MPTRNRPRRSVRGTRRRTTWATFAGDITLGANGDNETVDLLADWKNNGGVPVGCTILRTHARWSLVSGTVAGGDFFWVSLMVGQLGDIGANIAGQPQPGNDWYEDWMFWVEYVADVDGHITPGGAAIDQVDLRAKRKISELQQTYTLSCQRGFGQPLDFRYTGRVLLALP